MKYKETEIKQGIKLHTIYTDQFKTNLLAIFLTTKLSRENVTKNAVISTLLRRGSKNMKTQEEISKQMEKMYGASFDCGLDKTGDNQILKFYIETVNDQYLPKKQENILKSSIEKLLEIVFEPLIEGQAFKKEYVEQEKNNIRQRIEGKIDNKARYAQERCIEEMYPKEPYGLYRFGYVEDLETLNEKNLYEYYQELINTCKIDLFISGNLEEEVEKLVEENENIQKLNARNPQYEKPKIVKKEKREKENVVIDKLDVTQGKLVLGLDINIENEDQKYDVLLYNSILGGSANSKLFQNVREKAHLAYVVSSSYLRHKNHIFINCGIEIEDYEKAVKLIREQLDKMKEGDFSQEELANNKKGIIAAIKTINDEQDTELMYYFGQELAGNKITTEEYKNRIEKIQKEDIILVAKKAEINTIYFLRN